jgi:hypothetical protein
MQTESPNFFWPPPKGIAMRARAVMAVFLLCIVFCPASAQVVNENRLALVIGNATYKSSPLTNPVNDARLMEQSLKDAGFTVIKAENASRRDMQRLIRDFGDKLKQSGGVGLFYFAGHGVQVRGPRSFRGGLHQNCG